MRIPRLLLSAGALTLAATPMLPPRPTPTAGLGNVIFIHPDGASSATWAAVRALTQGPDGDLNWDRLPAMALYRGHMADSLVATSNGGATTHATGVKVASDAYGKSAGGDRGQDLADEQGALLSVGHQALRAGLPVGLVQTGIAPEPGSGCFLVEAPDRYQLERIAADLVESGARVLFSGGERHFVPEGTDGVHGPGERRDGRDLVARARELGYTVVFDREQLLALPPETEKVLGLFAHDATFNAQPEEELAAAGLPLFEPDAPTVGEMTEVALRLLSREGERFLLVVEEEGTDNFGNNNNAAGTLEAGRRADEAIGVAQRFLAEQPETLIVTAADSDGGGLRMVGIPLLPSVEVPERLPERARNGAPIDGVAGTASAPFLAAADRNGRRLPFYVTWSAYADVAGGVLVRADGLNSHRVRGSIDNTEIAKLIRLTLFGNPDGPR
ncbi:MAG: alkaline phosphatase [Planctomycetota bacterium]